MNCHTTGVGPYIPFDDPEELGKLLGTKKYPRGVLMDEIVFRLSPLAGESRMPWGAILSEHEVVELEKYFHSLENKSIKNRK
jgi:hypothetical protein